MSYKMQLNKRFDFLKVVLGRVFYNSRLKVEVHSHAAVGPMLQHQDKLLRLPVPPLQPSLQKYLLTVKPLLNEGEYLQTEKIVNEFGKPNGLGSKLHKKLEDRANATENWLSDWWLQTAYMEFRMPVIVYSSPGLCCPQQEFKTKDDQIEFAANMITGMVDYKIKIDKREIHVDMAGGDPLDMSQYDKIFSTCRIPGLPNDHMIYYSDEEEPPKHIVVAHNNHFFKLDVFGNDGLPLNEKQIKLQLQEIVKQSQHEASPIGVLSTEHRDTWAKAYKRLCSNKMNRRSVKLIEQAIFLACLDKPVTDTSAPNLLTKAALQFIHGGGSTTNSGNRWFDKTIQLIVGEDGIVGLTYEHSPAEGPPIANMIDYALDHVEKKAGNQWLPSTRINPPEKLQFELSSETKDDINVAKRDLDALIKELDLLCFTYPVYGREFMKQQKLGPDSYIQMAMQLAFYRLHNCVPATYESASTRRFLHGRTETIRSGSVEGLEFCKQMLHTSSTARMKVAALKVAVDAHKKYIVQATNGLGVDRLLFGLKRIAIESGMNVPELFLDVGYTTSTHFRLSSSQVPAKTDSVMCYGPAVPNGYGCCYNPRAHAINFGLSAFNSSPETLTSRYKEALEKSLTEMHDILILTQSSKL